MESAFIYAFLYPVGIAVILVVRIVGFVLHLPRRVIRHHRRVRLDAYILAQARDNAWAIHQATHPTPLKTKPWEDGSWK